MKKAGVATAVFAAVFALSFSALPGAALAGTASFNNGPGDGATLLVMNVTQSGSSATNWAGSVSAKPGDTVSFDIYYHNTGDTAAINTVANLSVNPSNTNISASASVSADNASAANGSAAITIPSGYTNVRLTFVGGEWYQNQGSVHVALPGGPNTFSLGTVQPGWSNQGDLIVRFRVDADTVITPPPTNEPNVHGYQDGMNGQQTQATCVANGWATDPDSQTQPVSVKIRVDGTWTYTDSANLFRSDLLNNGVCPGGNCAFNQQLTLSPGPHTITVAAVDNETGQEVPLNRTGQSIECSAVVQPPVCPALTVTTGSVLNAAQTQATVTGNVSGPANVWVEYGPTQNLGFTTPTQQISGSGAVTFTLTGLQAGTTYYFRLVAQGTQTGCTPVQGQILNFNTPQNPSNPQVCNDPNAINYGGPLPCQYRQTQICTDPRATNYGGPLPCQYPTLVCTTPAEQPSATTGAASVNGNSATLTGTVSANATAAWIEYGLSGGGVTRVNVGTGSVSVPVGNLAPGTYTFRVAAQNSCNTAYGQFQTFTIQTPACTAPTATLNQPNAGQNSASVSGTVDPQGGTASYYFAYGQNQGNLNQFTQTFQVSGSPQNVSATLNNLQPNTTYYVQLITRNSCGTNQSGVLSFTTGGQQSCPAPTVSVYSANNVGLNYATLNGYIDSGGYATTYWFQYGPTNSFGYTSPTQGPLYGAQRVSASLYNLNSNTTYYFTLVAQSQCGITYGQTALNFQTGYNYPYNPYPPYYPPYPPYNPYPYNPYPYVNQGPFATTNPATNIGLNYATLNGQINPNGAITTAWFEWGPTQSLGYSTTAQGAGVGYSSANVSATLNNLQPNTTYYFRVDAQNQNGTAQGQILSFTTGSGGTLTYGVPPTYTYQPPVVVVRATNPTVAGGSCLVLTPSINPSNPVPGGDFTYAITYRNDCPFDLQSASLRNYLPNEADFSATSYPFLTRDLNVITYDLGSIPRGFQNTIMVKGLVHPNVAPGTSLVFKSDLSFADNRGEMQGVSAFLTATVAAVGGIAAALPGGTASILDALLGFLSSGWFWFLLFLLLLALFILWLATRNRPSAELETE